MIHNHGSIPAPRTVKYADAADELRQAATGDGDGWRHIVAKRTVNAAASLSNRIRNGVGVWAPRGAFEAAIRGTDVYARYVGTNE